LSDSVEDARQRAEEGVREARAGAHALSFVLEVAAAGFALPFGGAPLLAPQRPERRLRRAAEAGVRLGSGGGGGGRGSRLNRSSRPVAQRDVSAKQTERLGLLNPQQPKVFGVKFSLREIRRIFPIKLHNF